MSVPHFSASALVQAIGGKRVLYMNMAGSALVRVATGRGSVTGLGSGVRCLPLADM